MPDLDARRADAALAELTNLGRMGPLASPHLAARLYGLWAARYIPIHYKPRLDGKPG